MVTFIPRDGVIKSIVRSHQGSAMQDILKGLASSMGRANIGQNRLGF